MIQRTEYLNQLKSFKDKQLIKVVTGIRRCGKSTLFDLYIEYLKEQGIEDEQIIAINLEDPEFHDLKEYMQQVKLLIIKVQVQQQVHTLRI
jgi:predicted AAA+ superfamily ATPase